MPSSFLQPDGRGSRVRASIRLRTRPATLRSSACSSLRAERKKTIVYSRTGSAFCRALQQALDLRERFARFPPAGLHYVGVVKVFPECSVLLQINKNRALFAAVVDEEFHARHVDGVLRFHRHGVYPAAQAWPLTVKLRGRPTTPDRRRGPTLSPGTRGAKQFTPHGPLQRLLGLSNRRNRDL